MTRTEELARAIVLGMTPPAQHSRIDFQAAFTMNGGRRVLQITVAGPPDLIGRLIGSEGTAAKAINLILHSTAKQENGLVYFNVIG